MCGIWFYLAKQKYCPSYDSFKKIKYRGPDKSCFLELSKHKIALGFHRLSIMDTSSLGDQPFLYEHNGHTIYCIANGEIYNFRSIITNYDLFTNSESDCEVLPLLYMKYGIEMLLKIIIGEFAFIIVDIYENNYDIHISRDQYGVRPIFYYETNNEYNISSEIKALQQLSDCTINPFPPGNLMTISNKNGKIEHNIYQYYNYSFDRMNYGLQNIYKLIVNNLTEAVKCRLSSDKPLCCLLSGGLDSSLVSAIASKYTNETLRTFSIGFEDSPDLKYARIVSEYIKSNHTEIIIRPKDALNIIPQVIYAIESYDTTTIRASTLQYLLAKYISENTDISVVLNGDYSDECCGGYMYFHNSPSPTEFHEECVRLLREIYLYDALRVDRTISHFSLEARVPFSDIRFISNYLSIDPELRMPRASQLLNCENKIEKALLREAFYETDLLPECIIKRHKEAFSDGASEKQTKSWYEMIQDHVNTIISDFEFENNKCKYDGVNTKESYYYRKTFESYFGNNFNVIPHIWLPKWSGNISEPSARILNVYKE